MFSGFDFGTSNCAIGVIDNNENDQHVRLLPINQGSAFMPSVLYSLKRELICESAALLMEESGQREEYLRLREMQLQQARRIRIQEDIRRGEETVLIGQEAFDQYLSYPDEGYFVKSVKSFLGSSGLPPNAVMFFEDIVTTMMLNIKQRAEKNLGKHIDHTVIGRPVNFQGVYPEESNRRALDILTVSAKRAGFKSVEFLYEPLAAGLDFETQLKENKTVLVVDIGGGTSDFTMLKMGPRHRGNRERSGDILGHSGDRVGGNDFDISLAAQQFMPLFGSKSSLRNGLPMPNQIFRMAVQTNNIGEQTIFNSQKTSEELRGYSDECVDPELIARFIKLREEKLNHKLVRSAEKTKIALSQSQNHLANLDYIEENLSCDVTQADFSTAVNPSMNKIIRLMDEVIQQAGCQPDLVYITGGSAKSKVIREAIEKRLGNTEIVDGDHFGSVAKGLTVWAQRLFS